MSAFGDKFARSRTLHLRSEWEPTERWLLVGTVLLVVAGVVAVFDASISTRIASYFPDQSPQRIAVKQSYRVFEWYTYAVIIGLLLMHVRRVELLRGFGVAVGLCLLPVYLLKFIVGRARPQVELGAYAFEPLSLGDKFDAFPSGHVGGAMVLALLVSLYYPRLRWVAIPLAMVVGLGRVIQLRHFPSDVFASAGVAVLAVYVAARWLGPAAYSALPAPWTVQVRSKRGFSVVFGDAEANAA